MSRYIEIISKIKPKNYPQSTFKIADLTDIDVNLDQTEGNVLCVNDTATFTKSGITWDLDTNKCIISGDLHISGNLYEYSDMNLKTNIIKIQKPMEKLEQITGIEFNWLKNQKHDYGIVAQEVQAIIPEMVSTNSLNGLKQVSYIKLIPFLLQALKQLNAKVKRLEKKRTFLQAICQFFKIKRTSTK